MSDLLFGVGSLLSNLDIYQEAEEFYEGVAPEVFTSGTIRKALKNSGAKFRVNWARTTVTAVQNRLEINSISHSEEDVTALIEEIWEYNQLGTEANTVHEAALEFGDTYVIVDADEDGEVIIYHNSPKNVRIFYSTENPRKPEYAIKVWTLSDARQRVNLYYADRTERYVSKGKFTNATLKSDDNYIPFTEDDNDSVIPNPYGQIPVFHFTTKFPYGRPEHYDAYGPQNMLNKLVVTQMATVDFQSFPQRYALQAKATAEGLADADEFFESESSDVATQPKLDASPGSILWLENVASVGEFSTAAPSAFLEPINAYITAMAQVTDTPIHAYQLSGTPPTGESRRMAEQPLLKKVRNRQISFGHTWKQVFKFALKVIGVNTEDLILNISWKPAESLDDKEHWEAVKAKQDAGVPVDQTLLESGYTQEQIEGWTEPVIAEPQITIDEVDAKPTD